MSLRTFCFATLTLALTAGCESYRPVPLDPRQALAEWRARTPDSVKVFADTLARPPATSPSTSPSSCSTFDASDGLSLDEAEAVALLFNPELRRARLLAKVARVGASEAGRWEDPSIGIDLERITSGTDDPWVVGGIVNLTIPLSGRLRIEKKVAVDELRVAELRALRLERQTIAELRRSWANWSAAVARVGVLEAAVDDLSAIEAAAAKLRDAAEIDPTDARLFAIDLVQRRAQLLTARHEVNRADSQLRRLTGLSPDAPVKWRVNPLDTTTPAPADLEAHPDVAIARAEYTVAERTLELEIRKQYPDLHIGGGLGTDQGDSRLLGSLSIPLPVLNANRRAIAEAKANRDVARAEYEAQLIRIESLQHTSRRDVAAAKEKIVLVERELVPMVDRQLIDARKLLEAGEFNPLLVREAIDAAAETKLELITSLLSLNEALVEARSLNESPFSVDSVAVPGSETK